MMYNNNVYPYNNYYGQQQYGGMQPTGFSQVNQVPPKKPTQTLTPEESAKMRKVTEKFNLGITDDERLRGICVHRDPNTGQDLLLVNPDGTIQCSLCKHKWNPATDLSPEEVKICVSNILDVLQSIKMLYFDMGSEAAREYFQIIPLLEKVPELYKMASDNFNSHERNIDMRYNGNPNTVSMFNILMGGAGYQPQPYTPNNMSMGQAPQPQYDMYGRPIMPQQQQQFNTAYNPGFNPQYQGQVVQGMAPMQQQQQVAQPTYSNGMAYTTTPQPGQPSYAPGTVPPAAQGPTVQQQVPTPPVAAPPAPSANTTGKKKDVKIDGNFK